MCYNIVTDRSDPQHYRATIHACCAHFMKMVSDRLSKENILNKRVKEKILKVMGLLVICNLVSETDDKKEKKQRFRQKNKFCDIETTVILNPMEPKTIHTAFEQPCQINNEYNSEDIEDVDDPSIIETWQKKRRSTSTYHLTTNKPLRNSKLFTEQTCSAGFENADKGRYRQCEAARCQCLVANAQLCLGLWIPGLLAMRCSRRTI
ncbi:hypothetical protein J6590_073770 [Homalodisca vitripennis]|nr:hypothetical protein J6590_073770 [Homalodisca vitripennis]